MIFTPIRCLVIVNCINLVKTVSFTQSVVILLLIIVVVVLSFVGFKLPSIISAEETTDKLPLLILLFELFKLQLDLGYHGIIGNG